MPIDGLISGLDTASIVTQLMELERRPIDALESRKSTAQAALDAYSSVRSRLSSLRTTASDLARSSSWGVRSASSSDTAVATVTASNDAQTGILTFTVDQVAMSHGAATVASVADRSDVISAAGTIAVTVDGTTHNISVGTGTLDEVIEAVNASGAGISAAAVNTGSGYRLQLNATTSGAASVFTVDSGLDIATAVTTQGQDAIITVGSGPGAYSVSSSSNVFSDTFDGLSVTARAASAQPVSLTIARDSGALADKVENLVTELNAALTEIKTRTAYDSETGSTSSLVGDSAVRRVAQELTSALTGQVGISSLGTAGLAGVSLDRYGAVTFDRDAFVSAYEANPTAAQNLFAQAGSSTGTASFVAAGTQTVEGDYEVVVTQAAKQATKVGMVGSFPITIPHTIRVKVGGITVEYATSVAQSAEDVASGLQAAIDAEGLALTTESSGGGLAITSNAYGSAATFDVAYDGTTYETAVGLDLEGTIGGQPAVGTGQLLTASADSGDPSGLAVQVEGDTLGSIGTVSYSAGIAQRLDSVIANATDSISGYLTGAEDSRKSRIELFDNSIRGYEDRLARRELRLRKQYADLEVALGRLQDQSSFLTQQLSAYSAQTN